MPGQFEILSGNLKREEHPDAVLSPEQKLRHVRRVTDSVLQDALDAWGDIWDQLQGSVTHGFMISPEAEQNLHPQCGWPEFMEKLWLLRHYLDYLKRLSEGKE
jgi:hypothetical protein